jgi:hypothetical protein
MLHYQPREGAPISCFPDNGWQFSSMAVFGTGVQHTEPGRKRTVSGGDGRFRRTARAISIRIEDFVNSVGESYEFGNIKTLHAQHGELRNY